MAINFDYTQFDFSEQECLDLNKVVFDKLCERPEFTSLVQVVTGVDCKEIIPYVNDRAGYKAGQFTDAAGCTLPECDMTIDVTNKTWDPAEIGCRWSLCIKDIKQCFDIFQKGNSTWNQFNFLEDNTDLADFVLAYILKEVMNAWWRITYFGDKTSLDAGLNGIDGFYTQMFAYTQASALEQYVAIPENAGATYVDQEIDSVRAEQIFKATYLARFKAKEMKLCGINDLVFIATCDLYNNLLIASEDKAEVCGCLEGNSPFNRNLLNAFESGLVYKGIPVVRAPQLDGVIMDCLDNGTKLDNPHRLILTTRNNMMIATKETESLDHLEVFYDKTDKKVYIDWLMNIDAQIKRDGEYILAM